MADQGRKIDASEQKRIAQLLERLSVRETARIVGVSPATVTKYSKKNLGTKPQ